MQEQDSLFNEGKVTNFQQLRNFDETSQLWAQTSCICGWMFHSEEWFQVALSKSQKLLPSPCILL